MVHAGKMKEDLRKRKSVSTIDKKELYVCLINTLLKWIGPAVR